MAEKLSTIEKIGGWISTILLGKTKEIIIRTDERVQHLQRSMDEVKKSVDDFRASIAVHGANIEALQIHTKYGVNNSPTLPNEKGKRILRDSGFERVYPNIRNEIFSLMDGFGLRTLYDYEQGAVKAMEQLKNNPLFDPLKEHSVNNPSEALELVFTIASWVIRDDYAEYIKEKNQ